MLDLPDSLVRGFSPNYYALRSALGPLGGGVAGVLQTVRMLPIAACYYDSPRHGEDARLVALSHFAGDAGPDLSAWDRLVERVCLRAAGEGKQRVLARPEEGGECAHLLHKLGFTVATRERVLAAPAPARAAGRPPGFEPLRKDDVWDAWKLYSRTEPVSVQRAEGLTPAAWLRGRRRRRNRQEWVARAEGNVVLHQQMLFGPRNAAVSLHYEPEHRGLLPEAVEHALAVSARRIAGEVVFVARDNQAELEGLLLDRGFRLARSQVRLVLYTSVLSCVSDAIHVPVLEKAPSALRTGLTGLSSGGERRANGVGEWV